MNLIRTHMCLHHGPCADWVQIELGDPAHACRCVFALFSICHRNSFRTFMHMCACTLFARTWHGSCKQSSVSDQYCLPYLVSHETIKQTAIFLQQLHAVIIPQQSVGVLLVSVTCHTG